MWYGNRMLHAVLLLAMRCLSACCFDLVLQCDKIVLEGRQKEYWMILL